MTGTSLEPGHMPLTFTAIAAGGIVGRRAKVDGEKVFLVEDDAGAPVLKIGGGPAGAQGTALYAAAGTFVVPTVARPPAPRRRRRCGRAARPQDQAP